MDKYITEGQFVIDDDNKAEWAIMKIKQNNLEKERLASICKEYIKYYTEELKEIENKDENGFLQVELKKYLDSTNKDKLKFVSGQIGYKKQQPKFTVKDDELVQFLEGTGKQELIKITKKADWASYKKQVIINGDNVVDENGEIVRGVEVEQRESIFEVKIK